MPVSRDIRIRKKVRKRKRTVNEIDHASTALALVATGPTAVARGRQQRGDGLLGRAVEVRRGGGRGFAAHGLGRAMRQGARKPAEM